MKLRENVILLFFVCLTNILVGQNASFTPPSPQSQDFIKYGDYPISYFTGLPDISIPLHEVNYYGYKLPITLKYHASGIKAGSNADATGLGWTLFGVGEISRTVHCVPDEWDKFKKELKINPAVNGYYSKLRELIQGWPTYGDMSYDEFNVTLPDGTFFKFYITNENGVYKIYTNPEPLPVKISFDFNNGQDLGAVIQSFTIIDEQGVKYAFSEAEFYHTYWGTSYKSSWKLTQITLPQSNKTIRFKYTGSKQFIIPKKNFSRVIRDTIGRISSNRPCVGEGIDIDGKCTYPVPSTIYPLIRTYDVVQASTVMEQYINLVPDSILFGDDYVAFDYAVDGCIGHTAKINNISLSDVKKKILLHQSNLDDCGRITRLDSIIIKDQEGSCQPLSYKFGYTSRTIGYAGTPAIDDWGYILPAYDNIEEWNLTKGNCNGYVEMPTYNLPRFRVPIAPPTYNADLCLYDEGWVILGNANREPYNVPEVTVNRIDYPTGGYTIFDYESNKYIAAESNRVGQLHSAGGYRIKTISSYVDGVLSKRKTYKYGVSECGYGVAPVEPSEKTYQKTFIDWDDPFPGIPIDIGPEARYRERHYTSDNFTNLLGSMPPVMYPEVTEYVGDANNNTGKTIYKYKVLAKQSTLYPDRPHIPGWGGDYLETNPVSGDYFVLFDESWQYGQLVGKEIYEHNHNVYKLKQKLVQNWHYGGVRNFYDKRGLYMYDRASRINRKGEEFYMPGFEENAFLSNDHYFQTGKATLTESVTTNYSEQSDSITIRESYEYDTYGHLAEKTTANSDGTIYNTVYKYPYDRNSGDFLNESLSAGNLTALDALVDKNIVAPVVQETQYYGQNEVTTKRTDFLLFNNKPLPQSIKLKNNGLAIEEDIVYTQYDDYGNPLQFTGRDGIVTSLVWGYNGQYLVAKIAGASYATVLTKINPDLLQSLTGDALKSALASLRTIPNCLTTTYTYKPFVGISSQTDPNGRNTYYEYDGMGRLILVKDHDGNVIKTIDYHYKQ